MLPQRKTLSGLVVFGYAAHGASTAVRERIGAFANLVGSAAQASVTVLEAASYEELAKAAAAGKIDLAWLPPIPFIALERRGTVTPLVTHHRGGASRFHSALIVARGSRFRTPADLAGARAAWVDPYSASGFVLPRVGLAAHGLDPRGAFSEERFYRSHDAAVRAVIAGRADFGATYTDLARDGTPRRGPWMEVRGAEDAIEVIACFGAIPGDVIAARSALNENLRAKLTRALLFVARDKANRALLREAFGTDDLRRWEPSGYAELRSFTEQASEQGLLDLDDLPADFDDVAGSTPMYGVRTIPRSARRRT